MTKPKRAVPLFSPFTFDRAIYFIPAEKEPEYTRLYKVLNTSQTYAEGVELGQEFYDKFERYRIAYEVGKAMME